MGANVLAGVAEVRAFLEANPDIREIDAFVIDINGQALGNYGPDQINMFSGSTTKASTSSLSGGENFSVTWKHS